MTIFLGFRNHPPQLAQRQVILGVPRPRAQSFLDGILQGFFGLARGPMDLWTGTQGDPGKTWENLGKLGKTWEKPGKNLGTWVKMEKNW